MTRPELANKSSEYNLMVFLMVCLKQEKANAAPDIAYRALFEAPSHQVSIS